MSAIGGISSRHIEKDVKKRRLPIRYAAAAAVVLIVLGAAAIVYFGKRGERPDHHAAAPTPDAPGITAQPTEAPTPVPTEVPTEAPIRCMINSQANGAPMKAGDVEIPAERWWTKQEYQDENAERSITIEFEGNRYTGTYSHTLYYSYNSYPSHYYKGAGFAFGINGNTGALVGFTHESSFIEYESQFPDIGNVEEETSRIAREFAKKLTDDIDEYEVQEPVLTLYKFEAPANDVVLYSYYYSVKVNDEETSALLQINVTSKGHIKGFNSHDIGAYPIMKASSGRFKDLDLKSYMYDVLISCMTEDYEAVCEEPTFDLIQYAVTPDGEPCIVVRATIDVIWLEYPEEGTTSLGGEFIIH
ncbi:MAG: hypothetical protein K6G56_04430 [Clostridiales bacterium]|nr:hypothetical protein [Clostridiales bacterium]